MTNKIALAFLLAGLTAVAHNADARNRTNDGTTRTPRSLTLHQLRANRDVTIDAGAGFTVKASTNVSLRASGSAQFWGSGSTSIKGSTIALN